MAYAARASSAPWLQTAATLVPAVFLFAFACLAPWYICRVQPLQVSKVTGLGITWAAAALASGGVLAASAYVTSQLLGRPIPNVGLLAGFGAILYVLSAGLHYTALAAEASRAAEKRAAEARSLARDAELHALRMQINPHFLFNSLHSIAALATQDGARAREMCIRLSDFLRNSLALSGRETIPLSEELSLARAYLSVEQIRFGARLKFVEDVDAGCEACAIPALLLQPLVENAVKHGIAGLVEGGEIRLSVRQAEGNVAIRLENAFDPEAPAPTRSGIGLKHVRRRLEVRYGTAANLDAAAQEPGLFSVQLRFPCDR
jgi:LytS/YehU family sensor histidine kinase